MKGNIKKAITILDYLAELHQSRADGMRELCKDWSEEKGPKGLALEIAKVDENVIRGIQAIKEILNEKPKRRKVAKPKS